MALQQFGTVLVARDKADPPSEIEVSFRHCSQRLKVLHNGLSGGADYVVQEGGSTVAMQLYGVQKLKDIERRWANAKEVAAAGGKKKGRRYQPEGWVRSALESADTNSAAKASATAHDGKMDICQEDDVVVTSVQGFRDAYRHTIVFFLLPSRGADSEVMRRQLTEAGSAMNVVQRSLARRRFVGAGEKEKPMGATKVFLVDSVASLQSHLRSVLDSLRPERIAAKEKYFARQRQIHLLPDITKQGNENGSTGSTNSASDAPNDIPQSAIAERVASALRQLAHRLDIPEGEMNVAMSVLGTLQAIASADVAAFDRVPVSRETKRKLVSFFSSVPGEEGSDLLDGSCSSGGENVVESEFEDPVDTDPDFGSEEPDTFDAWDRKDTSSSKGTFQQQQPPPPPPPQQQYQPNISSFEAYRFSQQPQQPQPQLQQPQPQPQLPPMQYVPMQQQHTPPTMYQQPAVPPFAFASPSMQPPANFRPYSQQQQYPVGPGGAMGVPGSARRGGLPPGTGPRFPTRNVPFASRAQNGAGQAPFESRGHYY